LRSDDCIKDGGNFCGGFDVRLEEVEDWEMGEICGCVLACD
jgi:hypothetical protein